MISKKCKLGTNPIPLDMMRNIPKRESGLVQVRNIFPYLPDSKIVETLLKCNNDTKETINKLISEESTQTQRHDNLKFPSFDRKRKLNEDKDLNLIIDEAMTKKSLSEIQNFLLEVFDSNHMKKKELEMEKKRDELINSNKGLRKAATALFKDYVDNKYIEAENKKLKETLQELEDAIKSENAKSESYLLLLDKISEGVES